MPRHESVDVIVVGAGPAGRALAHRAEQAGVNVTLVDPEPDRPWEATYGMFADDAPLWLAPEAIATRSTTVSVYTPHQRVIDREYLILDSEAFRRSLTVRNIVAQACTVVGGQSVTVADGTVLRARLVIDARGGRDLRSGAAPAARQTAFGAFTDTGESDTGQTDTDQPAETVLMDWRAAGVSALSPASFSYRVPTVRGLLIQETCLAGSPPIPLTELERRLRLRRPELSADAAAETVDFPLHGSLRPWRGDGAAPFGAAGGLMNPVTGYSVAQSIGAVDGVVDAMLDDADVRRSLWPRTARAVHLLRLIGLAVLLSLDAEQSVRFFNAFFAIPVARQRAYLSSRDDLTGVLGAMAAVLLRCPPRLIVVVAVASVRAAFDLRAA